jgi:NUMOD3 motif
MNYQKAYDAIVSRAKDRHTANQGSPVKGRYERHHIIPKSLGGSNDESNLVYVTPREHFILHLLLVRTTSGVARSKMASAVILMIKNTNKRLDRAKVTNRVYDASRFWKTAKFSDEHRKKISEAAQARDPSTRKQTAEANEKRRLAMVGVKRSEEHQRKLNESTRGKVRGSWGSHSVESKAKISAVLKGKPKSEEHRQKISEAQLGKARRPWSEERRAKFAATIAVRKCVE